MNDDSQANFVNVSKETSPLRKYGVDEKHYGLEATADVKVQNLKEKDHEVNNSHTLKGTPSKMPWEIYLSRALSAWGDRIWDFSLGIFMNKLAPESLRLAAIQGFVVNVSVIIFGSFIGNWIDKNKRLLAAKLFLSTQNIAVAVSCVILVLHFTLLSEKVTKFMPGFILVVDRANSPEMSFYIFNLPSFPNPK